MKQLQQSLDHQQHHLHHHRSHPNPEFPIAEAEEQPKLSPVQQVDSKKKEKYRNLWGKVGKQGALVAATLGDQPSPAPVMASSSAKVSSGTKWDQVLNPLLKKHRAGGSGDKKSSTSILFRKSSQLEMDVPTAVAAAYLQQDQPGAAPPTHHQINYMNAPDNSTTQCDCGDDSCPFCNLLLNMEMTDPTMLM